MEKAEARRQVRQALNRISPAEREAASATICRSVGELGEFSVSETVMLFASLPDEFDTLPLIRQALAMGKRVFLPKVDVAERKLLVCQLTGLGALRTGHYGVPEPPADRLADPSLLHFILMPGLAFDLYGNRLGRGAGYYDRLLAAPRLQAKLCGAALSVQVLPEVPVDVKDQPVHMLVTELGVFRFRE
jgi:5-formyltetrahydrofolate cyclo-ligase